MDNTCVYLIGPPGVGKFSVAKVLADELPARLVDNHYWNNPVFEVLEPDGKTPLPDAVWHLTDGVRRAVLEAIATLAPPSRNFIFTHAVSHDGGHEWDRIIAGQILAAARRRGARTLVVRLSCSQVELARRIVEPNRADRLKQRDGSKAEAYCALKPFDPGHPWSIDVDTTLLAAGRNGEADLRGARDRSWTNGVTVSALNIRAYHPSDADAVAALWLESWQSTGLTNDGAMSVDARRERLRVEGINWDIFVATDATNRIIAFVALSLAEDRLRQLFVSPAHQGQGIGALLLDLAKQRMPHGFWLWTPPKNERARRFYERSGVTFRELRASPEGPMAVHSWP